MKTRESESTQSNQMKVANKIGHILHQARLNKHYSLDDLHRITKIKIHYLKALDTGEFKKIPEGFYLRAFIKEFANTVGLNGSELLKRFNNELPDLQDPHYMNKVSENELLVRARKQDIRNQHSAVRKFIPLVTLIIVVFIVLVGIWIVAAHHHNGLTSNSNNYSTSMSGESSVSRPRHHKRIKRSSSSTQKGRVKIRKESGSGNQLVYDVTSKVQPIHLQLTSSQPVKLVVKSSGQTDHQWAIKADQKKLIKLPNHNSQVQMSSNNSNNSNGSRAKIKIKVNHHVRSLDRPSLAQSIILKFSK